MKVIRFVIFLMSLCKNPISPDIKTVKEPKNNIKFRATELNSKKKDNRMQR